MASTLFIWLVCLAGLAASTTTTTAAAVVNATSVGGRSQNDFIVGTPSNRAVLLYSQHVFEFVLNHTEFHWSGERIQRIEALDQLHGRGGHVYAISGGVDHDYVSIAFRSWHAADKRIEFVVRVYGAAANGSSDYIIEGDLSERSFLIHSERVNTTHFSWEATSLISRFEIVDQTGRYGHRVHINGGLRERHLRFFVSGELADDWPIDFLVNIYTEPNDVDVGEWLADDNLAHTEHIRTSQVFFTFRWDSLTPITRLVALDQTNGTGGFVNHIAGLGAHSAHIEFINLSAGIDASIDYIVHVYNEPQRPNDVHIGDLTPRSELLRTAWLEDERLQAVRFWSWRTADTITLVEVLDQTNGTGGRVDVHSLGRNDINLWFTATGRLSFRVNVYGERSAAVRPNDIMLGALGPQSVVIERREVLEWRWSVATYVFESERRITRIEIRDLMLGHGGRGEIVHGGIGNRTLVVLFAADAGRSIHFDVTVFAG